MHPKNCSQMPLISAEAHSAEHEKSDQIAAELSTLTSSGRARRQFLGGTALAAAGTSAALIARSLPTLAADAAEDSGRCASPAIPTPMKDVAGKVAFITGGNSGIGLGIARAFVAAGMKVAITYRTQANLDEAMTYFEKDKDRVYAVNVDVTDRAALESAADDVVKHFGKVNVVVANAGVAGGSGGISKASYDDWDWGHERQPERCIQYDSRIPAKYPVEWRERCGDRHIVIGWPPRSPAIGRLHGVEVRRCGSD